MREEETLEDLFKDNFFKSESTIKTKAVLNAKQ